MAERLPAETIDKIAAKMAELSISGVGVHKQVKMLSEEFNTDLNIRRIEKYRKRDVYQRIMSEYTDNLVKHAVSQLKREVSELVPLVTAAIKKALEEGNIQAIPHALKIIGIGEEAKEIPQQNLMVVLPGAKKERDVNEQ